MKSVFKKLSLGIGIVLLAGCHDMSGNAWIDSSEASVISSILGFVFFGFIITLFVRD